MNSIQTQPTSNQAIHNQAAQRQIVPVAERKFQAFIDDALKVKETNPSPINISNHALKRMEQRGIELDQTDLTNLNEAFEKLDEKGANNSLILYEDLSLIASVKNRTIITASKSDEMAEVTNIDSAILVKK